MDTVSKEKIDLPLAILLPRYDLSKHKSVSLVLYRSRIHINR